MRFEVTVPVAASADALWRWWTDYGNAGDSYRVVHGGVASTRRVRERSAARVVLEDGYGPFGMRREILVDESARVLRERPLAGPWDWDSTWRFERLGATSSRVSRVVEVRGASGRLASVAGSSIERLARRDVEGHVKDFEREHRERKAGEKAP